MTDDERGHDEPGQSAREASGGWPVEVPDRPGTPGTGPLAADDDRDEGRLSALPGHEDDQARGTADTVGGGLVASGGTAVDHGHPSEQPVPEEDTGRDDRTGMAGVPPGGPIGNT